MPLVKPDLTDTIRVSLDTTVVRTLDRYVEFTSSNRAAVIETALKRLFEQDEDWKKYKLNNPIY